MLKCNLNCILFDKADEGMYNHNIGVDSMVFCFKLTKGLYAKRVFSGNII